MKGRIYILTDPRDGLVRYCGKTVKEPQERLKAHLWSMPKSMKRPLYRWVHELVLLSLCPQIVVVEELDFDGLDRLEQIAVIDEAERRWIANLRRAGTPLLNLTSGGNGAHGVKLTPERIEKLRQANKNRIITPESCKRRSDAAKALGGRNGTKGREHPNWGNPGAYDHEARNAKTRAAWDCKNESERKVHAGRHRGEGNVNAKLTTDIARQIFLAPGSAIQIAKEYGVSQPTVLLIQTGRLWRHATEACGPARPVCDKRKKIDATTKAAILADTRSQHAIAKAYGISRVRIRKWQREAAQL